MKRNVTIMMHAVFVGIFALNLITFSAYADDDDHKRHKNWEHDDHDDDDDDDHRGRGRGRGHEKFKKQYHHEEHHFYHEPQTVYVYPDVPHYINVPAALPYGLDNGSCNRQLVGQIAGGVAGGALGTQIGKGSGNVVAIIGGTIIGSVLGGSVGAGMDAADARCFGTAFEYMPDDQQVMWDAPDGHYALTPLRSYETNGRYCREYTTTANVGGRRAETYGTACRQPDGAWQIISTK